MRNSAAKSKSHETTAVLAGLAAFVTWGLIPGYWKFVNGCRRSEILAHRYVCDHGVPNRIADVSTSVGRDSGKRAIQAHDELLLRERVRHFDQLVPVYLGGTDRSDS